MQYMLLIYESDEGSSRNRTGASMPDLMQRHMAFGRDLGAARVGGAGLKGTAFATTVRTTKGQTSIHDGPFAETKEQLGGYYLIDVPDLDAAIAAAKKLPLQADGSVEIRPLLGGG
jgi:hypothetical protein